MIRIRHVRINKNIVFLYIKTKTMKKVAWFRVVTAGCLKGYTYSTYVLIILHIVYVVLFSVFGFSKILSITDFNIYAHAFSLISTSHSTGVCWEIRT